MKSIEDKVCIGFIIFALMFIGWQTGRWFERSDIKQTIKARHNATIHYYVPQLGMHVFPFEKGFIQFDAPPKRQGPPSMATGPTSPRAPVFSLSGGSIE